MGLINRAVTTAEFGSLKYAAGINPATGKIKDEFKAGYTRALAKGVKRVAAAAGVEAVQETVQTAAEILNTTYDTAKYKDKTMSEILDEKASELLTGTIGGFFGGGMIATPGAAKSTLSGMLDTKASNAADKAEAQYIQNIVNEGIGDLYTEDKTTLLREEERRQGSVKSARDFLKSNRISDKMTPDEIIAVSVGNKATADIVRNAEKEAIEKSGAVDLLYPDDKAYKSAAKKMGIDVTSGLTEDIKQQVKTNTVNYLVNNVLQGKSLESSLPTPTNEAGALAKTNILNSYERQRVGYAGRIQETLDSC